MKKEKKKCHHFLHWHSAEYPPALCTRSSAAPRPRPPEQKHSDISGDIQLARNQTSINTSRRRQMSSDGGAEGRVEGRRGEERLQWSEQQPAGLILQHAAQRCQVARFFCYCSACLRFVSDTCQRWSSSARPHPFAFFFFFFFAPSRPAGPKQPKRHKSTKTTMEEKKKSPSCGSLPPSFLSTPFLNGFLPTFQHIALIHLLHDVVSLFFFNLHHSLRNQSFPSLPLPVSPSLTSL